MDPDFLVFTSMTSPFTWRSYRTDTPFKIGISTPPSTPTTITISNNILHLADLFNDGCVHWDNLRAVLYQHDKAADVVAICNHALARFINNRDHPPLSGIPYRNPTEFKAWYCDGHNATKRPGWADTYNSMASAVEEGDDDQGDEEGGDDQGLFVNVLRRVKCLRRGHNGLYSYWVHGFCGWRQEWFSLPDSMSSPGKRKRGASSPADIRRAALMGRRIKRYQAKAIAALVYSMYHHRPVLLADEMGIGKTMQVLLAVQVLIVVYMVRADGNSIPFVVVTPKGLGEVWVREMLEWWRLVPRVRIMSG